MAAPPRFECGCTFLVSCLGGQMRIDYCSRHAAADAMYEALDLAIQEIHNTGDISTATVKTMAIALALAGGKEVNDE